MKISPRLAYLIKQIPENHAVIDIAADHGYIAIELAKSNNKRLIIASDIAAGPLNAGKENAKKLNITNIDFRLGDGFSVLSQEDIIDTAIIAGIGGKLMANILDVSIHWNIPRFVLQANNDTMNVRQWLYEHKYHISNDERVEDGNFIYECLVAEKKSEIDKSYHSDDSLRNFEFYFGIPHLARDKFVYCKWVTQKIITLKKQINQMQKSKEKTIPKQINKYQQYINFGQEILLKMKAQVE